MKIKFNLFALVAAFMMSLPSFLNAQLADITYSVRVGNVFSSEFGDFNSFTNCQEGGNEEYTAFAGFYDDFNTTLISSPCMTCDNNGNCNYGGLTFIGTRSNNAYFMNYWLHAFEDDGGSRCNFDSGDDCRYIGSPGGFYLREYSLPSNGVYSNGPTTGNLGNRHTLRLDYTWRYSGTNSLLSPGCASVGSNYLNNALRSWSVNLVAGRTYRFSTVGGTTEDTYMRLFSSNGYSVLAANDDFGTGLQSQIDFTPTTSGVYYIELAAYVSSTNTRGYLLNNGTLFHQDLTTPTVSGGVIASNTTLCNGGSLTLSSTSAASGGFNGSFTYQWESSINGTTWTPITNSNTTSYATPALSSTTFYRRRATDCKGTTNVSNTITVTVVADPVVTLTTSTSTICTGGSTTLTANASGGTGNIVYQWQTWNGTSWVFVPGVSTSTYTVSPSVTTDYRVLISTNVSGCNAQATQTVTVIPDPTVTITNTNVSCNGGSNGTATVTVNGGTPNNTYSYLWSNGQTTQTATGLSAGQYTVTVNGGLGCNSIGTVNITQPARLAAGATSGSINCFGGTTTVTVTAFGGTAPYTGTGNFTVGAGTHTYTVTDANGCTDNVTITINEPSALVASSTSGTISCNGGTTTITVSATGGTAPYTGTGTFTVSAGTYTYTVTDANGCQSVTTKTVTQPSVLDATLTSGTITCNGGTTTVTVSATGGTAPYTGTGTFTVSAGTYTYTVTDANGCQDVVSVTLTQPTPLVASISSIAPNTTICSGGTAPLTASVSGGSGTVNYVWQYQDNFGNWVNVSGWSGTNVSTPFTNTRNASPSATRAYRIVVTSTINSQCSVTATQLVTVIPDPVFTITSTNVTCFGASDGTATATLTGGLPLNYGFNWFSNDGISTNNNPNGDGTLSVTGLFPAEWVINTTVSGNNFGCYAQASVNIVQPNQLIASSTSGSILCNGGTTVVTVSATGGTQPYQGVGTYTVSAGIHTYTVVDANGCQSTTTITVTEPTDVNVSLVSNNVSCFGANDGSVTAVGTGGTGTISYLWSNGETTPTISNLSPGNYSVLVSDANGCQDSAFVTITEPTQLSVNAGNDQIIYSGYTSDCVNLGPEQISGGTPNYISVWSDANGQVSTTVCPTTTTTYTLTVTDANGCVATDEVTICVVDVRCAGGDNNGQGGSGQGGQGNTNGNGIQHIRICHVPPGNPNNAMTKCLPISAIPAHLGHGDYLGECGATIACNTTSGQLPNPMNVVSSNLQARMSANPNPTNGETTIEVTLPETGRLNLQVYDSRGVMVTNLFEGVSTGNEILQLQWDSQQFSSGLYFVRLETYNEVRVIRLMVNN